MATTWLIITLALVINTSPSASTTRTSLKNVLYIIVDDLRPQLGCYGHDDTVRTPNIDKLANTGTLFQHAYVQIAVCSPSRTSFLTGLRPQQSNVLNFITDFRRATPNGTDIVSMPQFFKQNGVFTTGMGKTFHPGLPAHYDYPTSWSTDFPYFTAPSNTSVCPGKSSPWCSEDSTVPVDEYADGLIVSEALRQLNKISETYNNENANLDNAHQGIDENVNPLSQPFFMAVGLHRPHMDWVVPPSFLARQPPAKSIKLAKHLRFPKDIPDWAFYNCTELTGRARLQAMNAAIEPEQPFDTLLAQTIRRQYYAAVEYMDAQVGRLLDGLDELGLTESTAVVFHGDHGWKLGELGQWCKETATENDARTPLLIRAPWIPNSVGNKVSTPVEMIDLFVTLADLSGLGTSLLPDSLHGQTLTPLMNREGNHTKATAFSIYPRWKKFDDHTHCKRSYAEIEAIGLSVRTEYWRLTDWVEWDGLKPILENIFATELYDHRSDLGMNNAFDDFEVENVALDPTNAQTVKHLRGLLLQNFGSWPAHNPLKDSQVDMDFFSSSSYYRSFI